MKYAIVSLLLILSLSMYGCSSDETSEANSSNQAATENEVAVSQAETMEEIWASSLEPAEKAKRVQELLARSSN